MNPYTVILRYPESNEIGDEYWIGHVHADNWIAAELRAIAQCIRDNESPWLPEDFQTVAVFDGFLVSY